MNDTIVSYLLSFEIVGRFFEYVGQKIGFNASGILTFIIYFIAAFIVVNVMALVGGLGTYAERKISADMQMRIGPNRVGPFGILQFLADGVKMFMKEDIVPAQADRTLFFVAPALCLMGVFASLAIVPFSKGLTLSHLNVGVVYLLGVTSLVGIGIFLGGYSSNSKWSMLGGMRGASQIISYEIPVTLSMMSIVVLAGGLSFDKLVDAQTGWPTGWFIFHNPFAFIGFFIFFMGVLAETNRAPFDLPEAESELVSGYHTEFTGMRFAFFALAEYVEVFVVCAVASALFLGGYKVPMDLGGETIIGQFLQLGSLLTKAFLLYYVVIWIRWTLPRLRVDQLMTVCWKYLTPIALFNLIGCAFWVYFFNGKSFYDLVMNLAMTSIHSGGGH
jgi:NADH-quinone oxidoreductase subunit H